MVIGCCRERGHKFEPWAQLEADIHVGGCVVAVNAPGVVVLDRGGVDGAATGGGLAGWDTGEATCCRWCWW